VGTWGEFPESGIVPCAFLYGFMGVRAELDGLHVRPSLPTDLTFAGVEGLVYRGHRLKITAYRDLVVVEGGNRVLRFPVKAGAEVVLTEATLEGI
jgi:cellobiose phosphorylase